MKTGTTLVLVEFAGLGAKQTFTRAIPERPRAQVIVLDPLSWCTPGSPMSLGDLADRLGETVRADGAGRIALAAACTGVTLLAPLATTLADHGVDVALVAAVDPQMASADLVADTLVRLAGKLGGAPEQTDAEAREIAEEPDVRRATERTARLFGRCVDEYIRAKDMAPDEESILRDEVLPRYVAWVSYLLTARRPTDSPALGAVHVLTTQRLDHAADLFGATCEVRSRLFETGGTPGLAHEPLVVELRTLLAGAGW